MLSKVQNMRRGAKAVKVAKAEGGEEEEKASDGLCMQERATMDGNVVLVCRIMLWISRNSAVEKGLSINLRLKSIKRLANVFYVSFYSLVQDMVGEKISSVAAKKK